MPFKETLEEVYISGIKETLEDLGWSCHRSDERFDTPEVVCTICKSAQESSLILADLTGRNPNVFLEVGLAFGLEKYVVFLSQKSEDIPFDTRTFRAIIYDPHELPDLKRKIRTLAKSIVVTPKLPKVSLFENRCAELKRVQEVPQKPLVELFIGSASETKDWLATRVEGNLDLMRCLPDAFRLEKVTPRRKHFEFKSITPEILARMYSDGFFHCVIPWSEFDMDTKVYYLHWIMSDIAEPLFFLVRVMKLRKVETGQILRVDLHGISGLQVFPFYEHIFPILRGRNTWSFSKETNYLSYEKTFNPKQEWVFFFKLLCEIYKDICIDLGVIDIRDETAAQNVKEVLRSMRSLRTKYSGRGLNALSLQEVFGEQTN